MLRCMTAVNVRRPILQIPLRMQNLHDVFISYTQPIRDHSMQTKKNQLDTP